MRVFGGVWRDAVGANALVRERILAEEKGSLSANYSSRWPAMPNWTYRVALVLSWIASGIDLETEEGTGRGLIETPFAWQDRSSQTELECKDLMYLGPTSCGLINGTDVHSSPGLAADQPDHRGGDNQSTRKAHIVYDTMSTTERVGRGNRRFLKLSKLYLWRF